MASNRGFIEQATISKFTYTQSKDGLCSQKKEHAATTNFLSSPDKHVRFKYNSRLLS